MRALKLTGPGTMELVEVPVPEIADHEVLVKVTAAGLCHSDLHILHQDENWPFFGTTLGHETAGLVDSVGAAVTGLVPGEAVLVRALWACGECRPCRLGADNACAVTGTRTMFPLTPGLGADGGMADFIKVDARHLEKIGELDPLVAAPLADAGLTPMHNVNSVLPYLTEGATVVVIGIGGLGHVALQILAAAAPEARVIAVDTDDAKLDLARSRGASLVLKPGPDAAARILAEAGEHGVDAVLDFVGVQPTIDLAMSVVRPEGAIRIVGLGEGHAQINADLSGEPLPWGVTVQRAYGGNIADQRAVIDLANRGLVTIESTAYPLAEAQRAFDDLAAGRVAGRAVLVP
ncbi:alcohol dehydrogenase catalytic domain-containing protein [Gordonia sp. FQ]|uniref:alcohol dehydrogenase catalytic domain-containing protein n=1 Tax=Gordonia sp. FQ TaxID=3446634 RepID=UPI003F851E0E